MLDRGVTEIEVHEAGQPAAIREASAAAVAAGSGWWSSRAATARSATPSARSPGPGSRSASCPCGTGNLYATAVGIPRDLDAGDRRDPRRVPTAPRRRRGPAGPAGRGREPAGAGRHVLRRRLRHRVRRPPDRGDVPRGEAALRRRRLLPRGQPAARPPRAPAHGPRRWTASGPSWSRSWSWWPTAARRSPASCGRACPSTPTTACSTSSCCPRAGSSAASGARMELMLAEAAGRVAVRRRRCG